MRPQALWIFPIIFVALSGWYAWMAYLSGPQLTFYDDLTIVAAAIGGIVVGYLRASMLKLELVDGAIQGTLTLWGLVFLAVWMLGRALLRQLGFSTAAVPYGLFTDGLLAFATASICARSFVLARRCRELLSKDKSMTAPG
jgi:hypothetical protein